MFNNKKDLQDAISLQDKKNHGQKQTIQLNRPGIVPIIYQIIFISFAGKTGSDSFKKCTNQIQQLLLPALF